MRALKGLPPEGLSLTMSSSSWGWSQEASCFRDLGLLVTRPERLAPGNTLHLSLFIGHRDDAATSWHLEDIVAVVSYGHELGQRWVPEDGVVRQADVGDVEVDELGAVVAASPEGDREADLPDRERGTVGDSGERLGWLKLVIGHLEIVECFHGQDVEPCPTIDEGLGN